jgi:hypothetical protein
MEVVNMSSIIHDIRFIPHVEETDFVLRAGGSRMLANHTLNYLS